MTDVVPGEVELTPPQEAPPQPPDVPEAQVRPAAPGEGSEAAEARGARETAARVPRRRAQPQPERAPEPESTETDPVKRYVRGPQDDGPDMLERARLNQVNAYYRGTAAGALGLKLLAETYTSKDPENIDPDQKAVLDGQRKQYEEIVADLIAYDLMPDWSGLPSLAGHTPMGQAIRGIPQFGAAVAGSLAGTIPSPESFLGWGASGATWTVRTLKSAFQQGLITGATDPIIQQLNIGAGAQDQYHWEGTVGAAIFGAALGGGFHAAGEAVGHFVGQRELRAHLFDLGQFDNDMVSSYYPIWALDPRNGISLRPDVPNVAPREAAAAAAPAPEGRYGPGPEIGFDEAVKAEHTAVTASKGAAVPSRAKRTEEAKWNVFQREAGEQAAATMERYGFDPKEAEGLFEFYDRQPGEHPNAALERAIDRWYDAAEREAMQDARLDSEWAREMEELDRAFEREAEASSRRAMTTRPDFRGQQQTFEGGTYYGPRGAGEADIPFEPSLRPGEGGAVPEGGAAAAGPGGARAADEGRAGGANGGRREGERADTDRRVAEAIAAAITPERIAAAKSAAPEGVRQEIDLLVGMGADKGKAAAKDTQRLEELIRGYAPFGTEQSKPKETFAEQIARMKAERKPAEDLVRGALAEENPRLVLRKGDDALMLSKGTNEAPYRITSFDKEGPVGHRDYDANKEGIFGFDGMVAEVMGVLRRGFEVEKRPLATERTAQGEQTLMPGVAPVTDRQRAEAGMAKPMRGGEKGMPEGGLFDENTRAQQDIFDRTQALRATREENPMRWEVRRDADVGVAKPADLSPQQEVAVKSLHQQAVALADAVDVPLRQGRLNAENSVLGIYKGKSGVVRVRELADFEVVKHEVGHAIEAKVPEITPLTKTYEAELKPLDYEPDPLKQRESEGFAEWMRVRMENPAAARRLAPTFADAFDAMMATTRPDLLKIIDDTARAHRAWLEAPSVDAVSAVVQNTIPMTRTQKAFEEIRAEGVVPVTNSVVMKTAENFYQHYIDKWAPAERAERELYALKQKAMGGGLVQDLAAYSPTALMRSARRVGQTAQVEARFGIVPYRGHVPSGPGLVEVMNDALGKPFLGRWNNEHIEKFDEYLAARMSAYLWDRYDAGLVPNAPSPIKPGDAKQAIMEIEAAFPNFRGAADKLQEFIKNVRQKKLDAGIMTPDTFAKISEYDFYVPMRRVFEDKPVGHGSARSGETLGSGVRKRVGSERDIDSPLRNVMMDLFATERDIRMNEIGKNLLALAESVPGEGGKYAERLPAHEARKYTAPLEDMINDRAKAVGMDPDEAKTFIEALKDGDEGSLTGEFWQMQRTAARGEPIVFIWEGGKPVPIRVMSEKAGGPHRLFELMTETPQPILDTWVNVISMGAAALRGGITNAPTFILTNYIKDQLQVALTRPGYVPFLGGLKGIFSEVTEGRIARQRAYAGGVMGGSLVGEIEHKFEADIRDLGKQGYLVRRLGSWKEALELMQITEAGTRNSVFENTYKAKLKQGLSPYEAMFEAARDADDIMDFSRHGDRMSVIRKMIPFLNANIQGQDKYTFRTLVEPFFRKQITTRDKEEFNRAVNAWIMAAGGGIAFGVALAALNWEHEVYRDVSPDIKGTHFVIPLGDGDIFVIPKPFEMGIGFTAGEYAYAAWAKQDPRAASQFAEAVMQSMGLPNPIKNMPLVSPYIELMTNTSFYRNRPIVPESVQNKAHPELEYTERTSSLSKELGKITGLSPMKIDYAIGSIFGTVGRDLLAASSMVDRDSPTAALDDTVFFRRFIKDGERSSGRVRQFWDLMAAKNGKYADDAEGYRKLVREATLRGQPLTQATELLNTMPAAERAYVVMKEGANRRGDPAFTADDRRLHPLVRAHDAVTILNGLARDLQDNTLVPYRAKERLMLNPDQRRKLIDEVRTMAGAEMRNAFAITGEKGYEGRPVIDTNDFMDKIAHVSPNVADEIKTRYASGKVYTTQAVQEAWPSLRDEVNTYGTDANIRGISARARAKGYEFAGHRAKKPGVIRAPISGAPQPANP